MVLADELPPLHWIGGYHFAIVLPPFALSLNQVMGVYPRFEGHQQTPDATIVLHSTTIVPECL